MKTEVQHHQELLEGVTNQYKEVLDSSQQAVYIWLDNESMVCNGKFASLLGYSSAAEFSQVKGAFLEMFVAEPSQATLAKAYNDAMTKKTSSTFSLDWKKKNGDTVRSIVNLVPIAFGDHLFALHFIDKA